MTEIICHRGLWEHQYEQNTMEAVEKAIHSGFGVEIDIRYKTGYGLMLGHDSPSNVYLSLVLDRIAACFTYSRNTVIIHIKDKMSPTTLYDVLSNYPQINYKIIGVGRQIEDYKTVFGEGHILSEIETVQDYAGAIVTRGDSVWVAEIGLEKLDREAFLVLKNKKKKLYYVTPECFGLDMVLFASRFLMASEGMFDAVCTDRPLVFRDLLENGKY